MIEVNQLSKNYGERKAIDQLTFKINAGEVVGFLGPNGAGKSTTMKILTGFMAASSGQANVAGYSVFENPIEVKKRIGYLPETPPLYTDMLVEDYLVYVAQLKQVPSNKIKSSVSRALQKTHLTDVKRRLIQNLSKGFKQRVGIAQALVSDPEVLILDEPTVGLDPKQVAEIRNLIIDLKGEHTVILSTHILSEVQAICNKVIILHQGKIVAEDTIEGLAKRNSSSHLLNLKVRNNTKNLTSILSAISGVQSVKASEGGLYQVQISPDDEAADQVVLAVINNGVGLLDLSYNKDSLEDVFLKLTYNSQSGDGVS